MSVARNRPAARPSSLGGGGRKAGGPARVPARGAGCVLLALTGGPSLGESRAWLAAVELTGPVERVEVSLGTQTGSAALELELLPGERRELVVPLPAVQPDGAPRRLLDSLAPALPPAARFVGWVPEQPADRWSAVPAGLRARAAPPAAAGTATVGPAGVLFAFGALTLTWAVRRRPRALLVVAAAAAAGAWWVPVAAHRGRTSVLEELGGAGRVEVVARQDRLVLPPLDELLRLEVQPAGAPVLFAAPGADAPWEARAPGATLVAWSRGHGGALTAPENRLGDLAAVWVREDGEWTARGTWRRGAALPGPRPGPDPPGWLATGLPQGTAVVLGRLGGAPGRWVRVVGFETAGRETGLEKGGEGREAPSERD